MLLDLSRITNELLRTRQNGKNGEQGSLI